MARKAWDSMTIQEQCEATKRKEDRDRKNVANAKGREIPIPKCADPERRALCELDILDWLVTYFPKAFNRKFTDQQIEIVKTILSCATERRTQAIAAPRGSGKSVIARRVILFLVLTGQLRFAVIVAATGRDAKNMLKEIKRDLDSNKLLTQDYPEVCIPIRDVSRSPRKCALQTHKGEFTDIGWQPEQIKLPRIEGNKSSGAKIYARSLDGSIRGLNEDDERPEFVLIDDPETRESARSEVQVESRRLTLDQDISGLAVQGDPLGMLMLTTIQHVISLSMEFTDQKLRPAWNGKRWRSVEQWPEDRDKWEEYILIRKDAQQNGDTKAQAATDYYEKNRESMDAGAVLANPYHVPAGCLSAMQGLYNFIADKGLAAFLTEYQNDPPLNEDQEISGLSEIKILQKYSGLQVTICPQDTQYITTTIDLGKYVCHWQTTAWLANDAGFVIDYGRQEVNGTAITSDKVATDKAILRALREFREYCVADNYFDESGERRQVNLVMIDSGDFTDGVYQFVQEAGSMFVASKGTGETYRAIPASDKTIGNHYWVGPADAIGGRKIPLFHLDTNHWKSQCHDYWLTPHRNEDQSYRANSLSLYDTKEKSFHLSYAKHIVAEEYEEIFVKGKGLRRRWNKKNKNNHWLDTCYMAFPAREIVKQRLNKAKQIANQRQNPPIAQPEMFPGVDFGQISFT
jgi:hypothetical protein